MIKWKDETMYSPGEKGRGEPRMWAARVPGMEIRVHRFVGDDTGWYISVRDLFLSQVSLETKDIKEAKKNALKIVSDELEKLINRYEDILQEIEGK
jgi:hypothetical protein